MTGSCWWILIGDDPSFGDDNRTYNHRISYKYSIAVGCLVVKKKPRNCCVCVINSRN